MLLKADGGHLAEHKSGHPRVEERIRDLRTKISPSPRLDEHVLDLNRNGKDQNKPKSSAIPSLRNRYQCVHDLNITTLVVSVWETLCGIDGFKQSQLCSESGSANAIPPMVLKHKFHYDNSDPNHKYTY